MKKTSVFLSLVLAIFGFCSIFTFVGCDVSIDNLTKSMNAVDNVFTANASVFSEGILGAEGVQTKYVVDYGETIEGYVNSSDEKYAEFKELRDKYNIMLAVSQNYIDTYKSYILTYETHSKFTSEAKKAINELDKSAKEFEKISKTFFTARSEAIAYFNKFTSNTDGMEANLLTFKRAYGKFVSANVEISSKLAKCIEETKIFDTLKNTTTSKEDVDFVKDYAEVKVLALFNEYFINRIHNKLTWANYKNKESKVVTLYQKMETAYGTFKQKIVGASDNYKDFGNGELKNLFETTEEYVKESDSFYGAIGDFDFEKWAIEYDCDLTKYAEKNNRAEIDIHKMIQFAEITTINFINEFVDQLY